MKPPKEKVIDLLSKINNQEITPKIWDNASKGAKEDLKRKDWQEVKTELNKL